MSKRKRRSPDQIIAALREADVLLNAGQSLSSYTKKPALWTGFPRKRAIGFRSAGAFGVKPT
jgi:hypothetical protein